MVGVNIIAADTDEEANWLATSMQLQFLNLFRNNPSPLLPPVENMESRLSDYEKMLLDSRIGASIVGSAETVKAKLQKFLDETQADEMIINAQIYDHSARLKSFKIVSEIFKGSV